VASPAWSAGTPSLAAVVTATNMVTGPGDHLSELGISPARAPVGVGKAWAMTDVADQDVLRFIAVRDPQRTEPGKLTRRLAAWTGPHGNTPLYEQFRMARKAGGSVTGPADEFIRSESFIGSLYDAPTVIGSLDAMLVRRGDAATGAEVIAEVQKHRSDVSKKASKRVTLADIMADGEFVQGRQRATDSLLAASYGRADPPSARPDLMRIMALYGLLDTLVDAPDLDAGEVADVLASALVLLPSDIRADEAPEGEQLLEGDGAGDGGDGGEAAWERAVRLNRAADSIAAELTAPKEAPDFIDDAAPWVLTEARRALLSQETLAAIDEVGANGNATMPGAIEHLRRAAAVAFAESALATPHVFQSDAVRAELARLRPGLMEVTRPAFPPLKGGLVVLVRPPRMGDLEVVHQTLVGYEMGEIAHVESLLPGERKEREHRIVDVREVEETTVTERDEERSWDSQSTDRNELSTESTTVVNDDASLEAGLSVSARYGPYVEVDANVGYSKSNTTTTTTRNAATYAREVTERAAGRIQRRVTETRRTLTRQKTSERNLHVLQNKSDTDSVGYYRWLNKRYRAQVYNYGRRLLLELIVPDPAVNVRYSAARASGLEVQVDAPPPLRLPGTGEPLRPDHITPTTWQALGAIFRVPTLKPPPPEFVTAALGLQSDVPAAAQQQGQGQPGGQQKPPPPGRHYKASEQLTIPEGYQPVRFVSYSIADGADPVAGVREAVRARILQVPGAGLFEAELDLALADVFDALPRPGNAFGFLIVGPAAVPVGPGLWVRSSFFQWGGSGIDGLPNLAASSTSTSDLPVALGFSDTYGYAITVTVLCARTSERLASWQAESYAAILERHTAWEAEFRAAVRAARAATGVALDGRNPFENDQTVRTELKRHLVRLLGGPEGDELQAVDPGDPKVGDEPEISRAVAARVGPEIAFFEQGFDWPQMAWLLYPYFWTGRDDWPEQSVQSDPDPLFAQFLRAGAARIVLPVRRGFERVVCSRLGLPLERGWFSDPAPIPREEPWLSIVEEIQSYQRGGDEGVPVGAPWEVVLPTTLVALDDARDLFEAPPKNDGVADAVEAVAALEAG
jgi:hypothetical protein